MGPGVEKDLRAGVGGRGAWRASEKREKRTSVVQLWIPLALNLPQHHGRQGRG